MEQRDRLGNLHKQLSHEDMKNHFLSGDAIDETTQSSVEDFEIDRQVGNSYHEELMELPTKKHKI